MQNSRSRNTLVIFGLIFALAVLWLFQHALSSYFFQDDWFSFLISHVINASDFFSFFLPRNDVIYYRPLGMQVPFFLNYTFFGLNPLPFRMATFFVHLCNGILVYQIAGKFIKDRKLSLLAAFLYLTSATHIIVFYWAATFAFVLAPFFYFGCLLLFLNEKKMFSLILFCFGLFANELVITFPVVILLLHIFKFQKMNIKIIGLFWIPVFVYILFRLTIATFPDEGGYVALSSIHQLAINIRNYVLWGFNWPDEISNQFVSFLWLNTAFVHEFLMQIVIYITNTIIWVFLLIVFPLWFFLRKKLPFQNVAAYGFAGLWFLVTLSPVLYFSAHYFSYYLPIPLFGFILAATYTLKIFQERLKQQRKIFNIIILGVGFIWYLSALKTSLFDLYVHWAPRRAKLAQTVSKALVKQFPVLPPGATVIISNSEEYKWALGEENGLKVLYNDPTLRTFYGTLSEYQQLPHNPVKPFILQ